MFSIAELSICGFTAMKIMSECSTTKPVHRKNYISKNSKGTLSSTASKQCSPGPNLTFIYENMKG